MTYKTIYTTSGLTSLAAAVATGVPIVLTQMAVGDSNGNPAFQFKTFDTEHEAQAFLESGVYIGP